MKKLKDIKRILQNKNIDYFEWDNGQGITIPICELGDNHYDYGKKAPAKIKIDDEEIRKLDLENDHRVHFLCCENCCRCGGW